MRHAKRLWLVAMVLGCIAFGAGSSWGKRIMANRPAGPGTVNLPYVAADTAGNQWMFYQGGWFQQQGQQPTFGQSGMLIINGNQPQVRNNTARLDEETGEVIFDEMSAGPVSVTRHALFDREQRSVRYLDVLKNPEAQEVSVQVQVQSNVNYGVASGEIVNDPKRKGQDLAWVAQTQGGGAAAILYAGRGSKVPVQVNWQNGNNQSVATMRLTIPARGQVAICHVHASVVSQAQGVEWVKAIKEPRLLASIPRDLRRLIANFVTGQAFIGGHELLRGDATSDIVELRSGDQIKGTLKANRFSLRTFYGTVELASDRVIALLNIGQFRPRQLLVTADGQVYGGYLEADALAMDLSTGQSTQIPVAQITRAGYRKRPGEPEEWKLDNPMAVLRSGDRIGIEVPAGPLEVMTRYGLLKLPTSAVAAVVFDSDESDQSVHEIYLSDGSRLAGLLTAAQLELKLSGAGSPGQSVTIPIGTMLRLQLAGVSSADGSSFDLDQLPPDDAPTLKLAGGDLLVGSLDGTLKLDTALGTLTINAPEVRKLDRGLDEEHGAASSDESLVGSEVQVTLWDGSVVRGQLQENALPCVLKSGVSLSVPVALLEVYEQPQPRPSQQMIDRIKATVARLNADDWKQRDQAEAELVAMGEVIAPVLRSLRPASPPEAQQRIDQVLQKLNAKPATAPEKEVNPQPVNDAAAPALVPQFDF
jgi:hypothetical protein